LVSVDLLLEMLDQLSDLGRAYATRASPTPPPESSPAETSDRSASSKARPGTAASAKVAARAEAAAAVAAATAAVPSPVEDPVLREAFAAMHTSVVLLLSNLYVHSSRLSAETLQRKALRPTLMWGVGTGQDLPEDYEVALSVLSNRVFSAATQLDEPS
jgi:hypothetical protein